MKIPNNLSGPQFAEGDLVSFIFDESELTLRAPKIPYNTNTINEICRERDFRNADTTPWEHFGTEGHCSKDLLIQTWNYEDAVSHDDIAHVVLTVKVVKHSDKETASCFSLNNLSFRHDLLSGLKEHHAKSPPNGRAYWPSAENNFFLKTIPRDLLDGLQAQFAKGGGQKYPVPSAFFSLGRQYTLRISFNFVSLHYYDDRPNPYSEEVLQQFKLDVFDDFLSHIRIEYTPETIALIQKLKEQQQ